MDMAAEGITADSIFIQNSRPIKFVVNRINISDQDRKWITDVLIPELQRLGDRGIVFGRAAASPEGPYDNNRRLANQRRASVDALLRSYGIGTDHIQYDVVAEDYDLLYTMMMLKHDAKFHDVDSLITLYADDTQRLKAAMKQHDGGKLWRYLLKEYFPKLRAVRIIVVDKRLANIDSNDLAPRPIAATIPTTVADCHLRIQNADITPAYIIPATTPASALPRREVLSVKTNVLFDFAYMPGYDRFCPIPNVALEYYPLHGHFTYGASFDCPWWQHYDEHKYFQVKKESYPVFSFNNRSFFNSGRCLTEGRWHTEFHFKFLVGDVWFTLPVDNTFRYDKVVCLAFRKQQGRFKCDHRSSLYPFFSYIVGAGQHACCHRMPVRKHCCS